jgi:hypothetical protein
MCRRIMHWSVGLLVRKRRSVLANRSRLIVELLEDRLVPATFNVNSLADILNPTPGIVTLRSAAQMANETPGSNTINLTIPGAYKITIPGTGANNNATGAFAIFPNAASPAGSTLTIQNTSGGTVVVDGNHLDRVFDINPGDSIAPPQFTVIMQAFMIEDGIAQPGDAAEGSGGGIRVQGNVSLTLSNMTVANNRATADGGGIAMDNAASTSWTLTINNSTIANNSAGDAGGGMETDGSGTVVINPHTSITGNTAVNQGGGIWLDAIQAGDTFESTSLAVSGATISGNEALSAGSVGGGIGNAGNGTVAIHDSSLANNFAGGMGGGFGDENGQGSLLVQNSSFMNNTTIGSGGGIVSGGRVTILDSTFQGNFAGGTGGGFSDENARDSLTVTSSTFLNNTSMGSGGGIATSGMFTSVTETEIDGNRSGVTGGGLYSNNVTLKIQRSTLVNNIASVQGGGIEVETTGAGASQGSTVTDTTITGNMALNNAGANGGGVDAAPELTGDLTLLNDTINANFASVGGGIFWAATRGSNFRLQNTIVANNLAAGGADVASNLDNGTFTDLGGNLIGISGSGSGNVGFTNPTTQTGTLDHPLDPLLGSMEGNGGPTIGAPSHSMTLQTELLMNGSPAINGGIPDGAPTTDERGFPSVVNGAINIGATSSAGRYPRAASALEPFSLGSLKEAADLLLQSRIDSNAVST